MDAASLVFGDVVIFKGTSSSIHFTDVLPLHVAGDTVAADCRLLECSEDFTVDLSSLANEKIPRVCSVQCTDKENGVLSRNMVFMATSVVKGDAIGVVVATGDNTVWGQLISNHKWPLATDNQSAESERFIGNKA
ncbi:hypothetical protein DYB32_003211 [Aphanomyces invadans]|uniref:P-type ATPase A domain-containing protein n=1 Tax=Aphanomyces invadans TaxID=157072 RepID=A0A418B157_9STRA|nr:hypothetical protein DYB32_003211 [Aphanomyces invadans]